MVVSFSDLALFDSDRDTLGQMQRHLSQSKTADRVIPEGGLRNECRCLDY